MPDITWLYVPKVMPIEQARGLLADVSLEFEAIEQNLTRALELARDCHAAHEAAGPSTRRLFNQAFFEKLYVHDDGEITDVLAKPFKILLDPRLPKQLASGCAGRQRTCRSGWKTALGGLTTKTTSRKSRSGVRT